MRDDHMVIGNNYDETDAVEVYVNRDGDQPMQYAVVPGGGGSYNWVDPIPICFRAIFTRRGPS